MSLGLLIIILLLVFILPLISSEVEENLEFFLLAFGLMAAAVSGKFTPGLFITAFCEPLPITIVVFIAGLFFETFRDIILTFMKRLMNIFSLSVFIFLVVIFLGLFSSIITAIISAVLLTEILEVLPVSRNTKINVAVISCFAIGMGAVLTPVGEPLSTIAVSKLDASFWYLLLLLGPYVIPSIVIMGIAAGFFVEADRRKSYFSSFHLHGGNSRALAFIIMRAVKMYFFVMALFFLGEGFQPLIERYIVNLNSSTLYWINIISAVLDNATIATAELSPKMSEEQVRNILAALLASGGILIPGNIPNIISANRLNISSREWARIGIPVGLALMMAYYIFLI